MEVNQNIKLAVDAIVFGYHNQQLHLLLIQQKYGAFKGMWALPGGFVLDFEPLQNAVKRELLEEAGIKVNYLEQLYAFGDNVARDPRFRVVSVAYYALVNPDNFTLNPDTDASDAQWFEINKIPDLAFDHEKIINKARAKLKENALRQPVGFDLLNNTFPFSDLEHLYRAILGNDIDRRNFRKKILSYGILEKTDEIHKTGSGRPGKMFKFNKEKYLELEKSGFHFEIKYA